MCCTRSLEIQDAKMTQKSSSGHHRTTLSGWILKSSQLRHVSTIGKNLLNTNISSTCPHYNIMANFGLLAAEIGSGVWGTLANFNGFRVLAALLHGTLVAGVSQTLQRWTEGATHIRQGGHHVWHWPTFYISSFTVETNSVKTQKETKSVDSVRQI